MPTIAFVWGHGGPDKWDDRNLETGIGGSEAMMIFYARAFAERGWTVTCFAPEAEGTWHSVEWLPKSIWPSWNRHLDVAVAIRDPSSLIYTAAANRVFLANDQGCAALEECVAHGHVTQIVTISEHQTHRYQRQYPSIPQDMYLTLSAGVDYQTLCDLPHTETKRCLYTSTPERGLLHLARLWPRILERVPDAELYVTSGFQLYGWDDLTCAKHSGHIYDTLNQPRVHYVGPLSRHEYLQLLTTGAVLTYPSIYDEMCCISALEAAACGIPIVSTPVGAMKERVVDGVTGYLIPGLPGNPSYDEAFIGRCCDLLADPQLRNAMGQEAQKRTARHDYRALVDVWMAHPR